MLLWAAISLTPTTALIGYDCAGEGLNVTTLSLTDIGDCRMENLDPKSEEIYAQLLQLSEFDHTTGIQCRVEIDRMIYYCGMHSHISTVQYGKRAYIQEISAETCRKIHETGSISLSGSTLITGIKVNATTSRSITFAGSVGVDGRCMGTQYSDPYGTWENVVVQATVKIATRKLELPIKYATDEAILPSGARCKASDGECNDANGMTTFWTTLPRDSCQFRRYDVLYEGPAHRLTQADSPTVYTVTTKETTFALAKTTETNLCGYKITRTEHPKLFILETQPGKAFKTQTRISVDNLDIFSYVNSKFIHVEKHLKTQLTQLYRDIMSQKCALEKQILENALSLATIAPDEMAYRLMKTPGYTAITAGEVIYIVKCVPVQCKVRQTERCYNELPVTHNNASYFLAPRSRILTKGGTTRDCSELLPSMYQINGAWFRMTPRPAEALPPPVIQPLTKPKWKYVSPSDLATSGIYSTEDLDRLRNHIMFPVEKPSMLDTLAQGAMGHSIPQNRISMFNLMDTDSLERIAESASAKLWQGFVTFGSASAGVLAIIMIIRLIKLMVDSLIRGYALHTVYGWSIHLLGAIWSSITHLLLQLGSAKQTTPGEKSGKDEHHHEMEPLAPHEDINSASVASETAKTQVKNYGELNKYLQPMMNAK